MIISDYDDRPACTACTPRNTGYEGRLLYIEAGRDETLRVERKKHNYVFFIIAGNISVYIDRLAEFPVNQGQMVYIPRSADCEAKAAGDVKLIAMTVDMVSLPCGFDENDPSNGSADSERYAFGGVALIGRMADYVDSLREYIRSGLRCAQMHEIKEKEFFMILKHFYGEEDRRRFFHYSTRRSLSFPGEVNRHFREVKTAGELASRMGYGVKTFERLFRECFGTTPYKWMQARTANLIRDRLMDPAIPLKQIMHEFDFATPSHFNAYCKRLLGTGPCRFRKMNAAGR